MVKDRLLVVLNERLRFVSGLNDARLVCVAERVVPLAVRFRERIVDVP
jgi:hypothetical protein